MVKDSKSHSNLIKQRGASFLDYLTVAVVLIFAAVFSLHTFGEKTNDKFAAFNSCLNYLNGGETGGTGAYSNTGGGTEGTGAANSSCEVLHGGGTEGTGFIAAFGACQTTQNPQSCEVNLCAYCACHGYCGMGSQNALMRFCSWIPVCEEESSDDNY